MTSNHDTFIARVMSVHFSIWWPILSALTIVVVFLAMAAPMAAGLSSRTGRRNGGRIVSQRYRQTSCCDRGRYDNGASFTIVFCSIVFEYSAGYDNQSRGWSTGVIAVSETGIAGAGRWHSTA